ncbi:MAG: hypothetical protein KIH69_023270 [Anaerolineae bacterium]|nr:hypothetical protein [Anaerolineae bacterium]
MQHTILISPDLKISPRQVAQAWNTDAECKKLAIAEVSQSQTKSFDPTLGEILKLIINDPTIQSVATYVGDAALSEIIGGTAHTALLALIYKLVNAQSKTQPNAPKREIILNHTRQPDGTEVTIVHYKE